MSEENVPAIEEIEILQPGQFAQFEAAYPVCGYRSASGKFVLTLTVGEQVWLALKQIPKGAMLDVVVRYHNGDLTPEKGPHGLFWSRMFGKRVLSSLDLRAALGVPDADEEKVKEALKSAFDVTSLTWLSPQAFIEWATAKELHGPAAIARQQSQYR